jgi:hypothetical protein
VGAWGGGEAFNLCGWEGPRSASRVHIERRNPSLQCRPSSIPPPNSQQLNPEELRLTVYSGKALSSTASVQNRQDNHGSI